MDNLGFVWDEAEMGPCVPPWNGTEVRVEAVNPPNASKRMQQRRRNKGVIRRRLNVSRDRGPYSVTNQRHLMRSIFTRRLATVYEVPEEIEETETPDNSVAMVTSSGDTAPLSSLPTLSMENIELQGLQLHFSNTLQLSEGDKACQETRVYTDRGVITVGVQGDRAKPVILTYHDVGMNYKSFQKFFNYVEMRALLENFCVYHVNAPGQEEGAPTLPEDYVYPNMDELASQINYVLMHFGIKSFIGVGVGAGANILARFALVNPEKVDALMLVNCPSSKCGWVEWALQKLNTRLLRSYGMTPGVIDYLMWHHFGKNPDERCPELAATYRAYFRNYSNPGNLALFLDSYALRRALEVSRFAGSLRMPVLNVVGALSPMVEDTIALNARLNPSTSTWMKISDSVMPLDDQPAKVSEAFRLFLQGEGYVAPLSPTKIVAYQRLSDANRRRACRHSPVIRITENPISEACSVAC